MTYEEAREYISQSAKSGIQLGLSRMRELCRRLDNVQDDLTYVHIAGTNGKGSTAAYISSVLATAGQVVGRYVSPVVFQYEEAIQYEDTTGIHYIDKTLLAELVTKVSVAVESMVADGWEAPTVFEIETAVSFLAFVHWNCTIVVLEVGMGGGEDATNVIHRPLMTVITSVSKDHTHILGDSLTEIARAKAGIIKQDVPVVTAEQENAVMHVIKETANAHNATLTVVDERDCKVMTADYEGISFAYRAEKWQTGMLGIYQVKNACLAISVCYELQESIPITKEDIFEGIAKARWRGRFEVIDEAPLTIQDGAHNPSGAIALAQSIERLLPEKTLHGVMGVFRDKDYKTMIATLLPYFSDIVAITAPGERGLDKAVLAEEWRRQGCPLVSVADTLSEAKEIVARRCQEEEGIVLFGSLSFLGDCGK